MAKFVIYKDIAGQYRWRLVASNGEKIASGESYVSKQGALDCIRNVKILAQTALIIDRTV